MNLLKGFEKSPPCLESSSFWKVTNEMYPLCDLTIKSSNKILIQYEFYLILEKSRTPSTHIRRKQFNIC